MGEPGAGAGAGLARVRGSLALLTDLYQFTMAYGYWRAGRHREPARFELFFRRCPFQGGFALCAGLSECLAFLRAFRFAETGKPPRPPPAPERRSVRAQRRPRPSSSAPGSQDSGVRSEGRRAARSRSSGAAALGGARPRSWRRPRFWSRIALVGRGTQRSRSAPEAAAPAQARS